MRAVVQRVLNAAVTVDGEVVGSIARGLCVLVGLHTTDTVEDMEYIVRKVLNTRLWDSDEGKSWHRSVKDIGGDVLFVSQFTLFGYLKGNKPDFHNAMAPGPAAEMYAKFVDMARAAYPTGRIEDGRFGAMMQVSLINDGPVTLLLDSRDR